jgi:hypothetical protein
MLKTQCSWPFIESLFLAKKGATHNGRSRLDEAMATLTQSELELRQSEAALNQSMAAMNQSQLAFHAWRAERDKEMADLKRQTDERFAAIMRLLAEHTRLLERMPEAVLEKISFQPQ